MKYIDFETVEALTAHAIGAFKDYSGPYPEWVTTARQRAHVFAKRCAFGHSTTGQLCLEDTEENMAYLEKRGEILYDRALAEAEAEAEERYDAQDLREPDALAPWGVVNAMKEANEWPCDFPDEHWYNEVVETAIFEALTTK